MRNNLLLFPLTLSLFLAAAQAAPLCVGTVTDAAQFAALGSGGCQFGNAIFYGFDYSYQNAGSPAVPAASVAVTFSNAGGDPMRPVITFSANWDALAINEDITDIRIHYSASIVSGLPSPVAIVGGNMTIGGNFGFSAPDTLGSFVSAAEKIVLDVPGPGQANVDATILPTDPTPFQFLTATSGDVSFAPQTQVSISKDIQIFAGDPPDDGQLLSVQEGLILAQGTAPEPGTYVTFGGGLVGLALLLRKRVSGRSRI